MLKVMLLPVLLNDCPASGTGAYTTPCSKTWKAIHLTRAGARRTGLAYIESRKA